MYCSGRSTFLWLRESGLEGFSYQRGKRGGMSNSIDASDGENMNKDIDTIRAQIDALDDDLLELLRKRFELCVEMGALKGRTNRDAFDPHGGGHCPAPYRSP